ncbi:protein of unknown function DUF1016 [Hymenobacter roseosalivarius DSM 11622]|uniref:YhcG N-terminal domain-containing protein n=1 Tax=Hymenobacter roseosalivarius DSM 11622 TaxID=645990 RepID=A0A1W1UIE1_9BACT|nr:DUF1016 N-terminal domain-containing protein [Hymenobacter roseosalivarius]SMB80809.1 protein of unknown function DUF1016 [Hymenobacter roseosalivarius DSM 11622]
MSISLPSDYQQLLTDIKERVRRAQYQALRQVNQQQIALYWELGQLIVEKQQQHQWGKRIVETLAQDLQQEFVGLRGFSAANLWRMRTFYLVRHGAEEVLAQAVRELGWGHNITLLEQCQEPAERLFCAVQARRHG